MLTQKKGKQVRLYILEDDEPRIDALAKATGLDVTTIMTLIVSAGTKACSEIGHRIPLPLKFKVVEESSADYRLNEPQTHKRK